MSGVEENIVNNVDAALQGNVDEAQPELLQVDATSATVEDETNHQTTTDKSMTLAETLIEGLGDGSGEAAEGDEGAASKDVYNMSNSFASVSVAAVEAAALAPKRRIRVRHQFERLDRPATIKPGEPVPSVEGWTLLMANLPPATTEDDLRDILAEIFAKAAAESTGESSFTGELHEVKVLLNKECECIGHALVELEEEEAANYVVAQLNGKPLPPALEERFQQGAGEDGAHESPLLRVAFAFIAEDDMAEEEELEAVGTKRARD